MKTTAANILSHTPSYPTFHWFPASTHLQIHETSSFELGSCLCDVFQPYRYTKPWLPTFSAIPPHTRRSIDSLCQPTSKCMKRVRLNSFHVSMMFSSPTHTRKPKAANTISHTPSYLTFHRFPASTHLQMHETSSVELVSCFRNLFQPYGYTKYQGCWHSQPYTLIPNPPSIPCINPPPKARNEFVQTCFVFLWPFPALQTHENWRWLTLSAIPHHIWLSVDSLCQPTSKCMKRVCLNSFHILVTISGHMDTWSPKAANTLSHTPSYLTSHPFPASSRLQMCKTSSFELISCFSDLFQPYRYTKIQGSWHSATPPSFPTYCVFPASTTLKQCVQSFLMDGQGCMVEIHANAGVVMRLKSE